MPCMFCGSKSLRYRAVGDLNLVEVTCFKVDKGECDLPTILIDRIMGAEYKQVASPTVHPQLGPVTKT